MRERVAMKNAIRWINKLEASERLEDLWPRFEAWLEESPENRDAYHRAERARRDVDDLLANGPTTPDALLAAIRQKIWWLHWQWLAWGALAVAGTVAVVCIAAVWTVPGALSQELTYRTKLGEVNTYTLEDGSVVLLDTDTLVRSHFSLADRRLDLIKGRIFVTVQKERWRAFDVDVNHHVVRAVGTQFVVYRKSDDEFSTLVQQGLIAVTTENAADPDTNKGLVTAGNGMTISARGVRRETNSTAELDAELAWKKKSLVFQNKPLIDAVNDFNRYNNRKLFVDDHSIEQRKVVGIYHTNDPDGFARGLADSHEITNSSIGAPGSNSGEIHLRAHP